MSIFHTEYLKQQALAMDEELIAIRRKLHAYPELGTKEVKTDAIITEYLTRWASTHHFHQGTDRGNRN